MVGTRSQRVPLSSLTALTLHHDRLTASRRTPPIPQLSCRGSPCATYQPPVVQCVAVGSDGAGGLEWKCDADLPRGVRFGAVEVGCEGWDAPGDDYVLRGSCALEYELVRAAPALEDDYAYGAGGGYGAGYKHAVPASLRGYLPRSSGSLFNSAFNLVFAALTAYLALSFLAKLARRFFPARPPPPGGRTLGGGPGGGPPGGGGGGGPSHGGPPPPYTPTPTPKPPPVPPHDDGGAAWRPGFWTGAAAGWAVNALLGAARPRERERVQPLDYAAAFGEGRDLWAPRERMPPSQESSGNPSPPTFKRQQPAKRRKKRPAPSPPADLTQWRLVNSAAGAAGRVGADEAVAQAQGAREAAGAAGGAAPGGATGEARRPGFHPAVAAAWGAPSLWDECDGGVEEQGEAHGIEARQGDDEPLSSLTPLTRSTSSSLHASHRRRSADNDENLPPSTISTRTYARRTTSHRDDDDAALPTSLDELYAHVLPRTRRALSRTRTTKTRHTPSPSPSCASDADVPSPPKRKKRRIPPTPPDSSWEEHDLTPPDRTVPLKYPLSRHATQAQPHPHAYLGPDFLGAAQLESLSPRARNELLRPPRAPRLNFGSSPTPSVEVRASRRRGARRRTPLALGDSDDAFSGGEGPPRLAAGQAAKGVFLEGVAQTGFAGAAPAPPAPAPVKAKVRRERVRLQSVQDLGARFEERALRDAPYEGVGAVVRPRARAPRKPRLRLGPEDEAGDVGELDERAAHLYITTARPLPPRRKPGGRPAARPLHFRFAPIRRPPPAQLISLRPAPFENDSSRAQLEPYVGGAGEAIERVGSHDQAATSARSSKQRPPSFRFVVGAARSKMDVVDEEGDLELGGSTGGSAQHAEETPRAGGRPCTPSSVAPAAQSSDDVFLAGHRPLRRMSTYGVSLFAPRHESDPLEDKETPPPPPRALEPIVGAPATPQSEVQRAQDAHESSHSYRDGHADTPSLPVPARSAAGPTPPRTSPLPLVTPSLPFPPAQQPDALPHRAGPSRSPSSTSSFDRSVLDALHGTASSPLQAHYPPNLMLLPGMATRTSSGSTSGLALPIPLRTPYASFQYSSPPLEPSVSAVGPTMPDEEEDDDDDVPALLPTEQLGARTDEEQVPPTSALGPPSPSSALDRPHPPSDAYDEHDDAPGDDDDVEVHYTALAVAARTRRALEPARRSTVGRAAAPPPQRPQRKAQTTAQGVLTPPESTRKPARRGAATRG